MASLLTSSLFNFPVVDSGNGFLHGIKTFGILNLTRVKQKKGNNHSKTYTILEVNELVYRRYEYMISEKT